MAPAECTEKATAFMSKRFIGSDTELFHSSCQESFKEPLFRGIPNPDKKGDFKGYTLQYVTKSKD
jgi:hypothetical protein